jgi:hypothetical protein
VLDFVAERRTNSQWHHRVQSGRVDDVLDAAVLALTARATAGDYPTLLADADPSCDPLIVYPGTYPRRATDHVLSYPWWLASRWLTTKYRSSQRLRRWIGILDDLNAGLSWL